MKKKKDFLEQKLENLHSHNDSAASAVSIITSTISQLRHINEAREIEIKDIEDYLAELTNVHNQLTEAKMQDDTVISNFSALLAK